MAKSTKSAALTGSADSALTPLVVALRDLIRDGRARVLRAADAVQVATCWEIGRHIVEFEQAGRARAEYGKARLPTLAARLTAEFGRGFDASNLRYMRLFYNAFRIRDALRHELSWTHYRILLRVDEAPGKHGFLKNSPERAIHPSRGCNPGNWIKKCHERCKRGLNAELGRPYRALCILIPDTRGCTPGWDESSLRDFFSSLRTALFVTHRLHSIACNPQAEPASMTVVFWRPTPRTLRIS